MAAAAGRVDVIADVPEIQLQIRRPADSKADAAHDGQRGVGAMVAHPEVIGRDDPRLRLGLLKPSRAGGEKFDQMIARRLAKRWLLVQRLRVPARGEHLVHPPRLGRNELKIVIDQETGVEEAERLAAGRDSHWLELEEGHSPPAISRAAHDDTAGLPPSLFNCRSARRKGMIFRRSAPRSNSTKKNAGRDIGRQTLN